MKSNENPPGNVRLDDGAATSAPAPLADTPAAAEGRRTLSTAFIRMGAGEHLTVELRDGRTVILRDVVLRRDDYCGEQLSGGAAGRRYCGGYADIVAARPVGATVPDQPDLGLNPVELKRSPSERD